MTTSGVGETNNEKVPVPVRGSDDNNEISEGGEGEEQKSEVAESEKSVRGAGSSSKAMRKKSEVRLRCAPVFDGPEVPPPCEVCGKVFPSWKSLFGHMRSHPERSWRGVKPPPIFTPPASPKGDEDASSMSRGPLAVDFDLNDPMEEEDEPPSPKRQRTFDLNMPAPEDDDEEADH